MHFSCLVCFCTVGPKLRDYLKVFKIPQFILGLNILKQCCYQNSRVFLMASAVTTSDLKSFELSILKRTILNFQIDFDFSWKWSLFSINVPHFPWSADSVRARNFPKLGTFSRSGPKNSSSSENYYLRVLESWKEKINNSQKVYNFEKSFII